MNEEQYNRWLLTGILSDPNDDANSSPVCVCPRCNHCVPNFIRGDRQWANACHGCGIASGPARYRISNPARSV